MKRSMLAALGLLASLGGAPPLKPQQTAPDPNPTIAIIDGAPIKESDLNIRAQLMQMERQKHDLRQRVLENLIANRLVEKAAAAKSLSREDFLRQEVDAKIPDPTREEAEGYYWGQKEKFRQPFEQVRVQVTSLLKSAKIREGRQVFLQKLREGAAVEILIEPPRLAAKVGQAPRRGPAAAPVTIVEFTDFQCPYCKNVQPVLKQLLSKYGDQLSLAFKDLPIQSLHPEAQKAAEAARCAGDQGKFWEYHDALFQAARIEAGTISELSKTLSLNTQAFESCLSSRKHQAQVETDVQEAQGLGISGTPAFLINGVLVSGSQTLDGFSKIIDSELAAAKRRGAGRPN